MCVGGTREVDSEIWLPWRPWLAPQGAAVQGRGCHCGTSASKIQLTLLLVDQRVQYGYPVILWLLKIAIAANENHNFGRYIMFLSIDGSCSLALLHNQALLDNQSLRDYIILACFRYKGEDKPNWPANNETWYLGTLVPRLIFSKVGWDQQLTALKVAVAAAFLKWSRVTWQISAGQNLGCNKPIHVGCMYAQRCCPPNPPKWGVPFFTRQKCLGYV